MPERGRGAHAAYDLVRGLGDTPAGPDLPPGPPPPRPQPSAQPARQVLHAELDEAETARLLSSARDAYRLSLTELCLAALALARSAAGWAAADVEVVTDPRADAGGETDISRSVGAFSAAAPVRLDFAPAGPGELLAAVKQLLRGEPAGPGRPPGRARATPRAAGDPAQRG